MVKKFFIAIIASVFVLSLAACGKSSSEPKETTGSNDKTIIVGASNVPHAVILEKAKPILKKKGYNLKIVKFQDYIMPNKALAEGKLDANYFQHIPYFKQQIKENGYKFANAGGIHIEPIGLYSKKYKSLDQLPKGAEIIMSSSVADHGRILTMLEKKGLIKLKKGVNKEEATVQDIAENPKHFKFKYDVEASMLPQVYKNGEGDAVLINSNYALDAGLNPLKDAIALEDKDSPYVNIIAVRKGDEKKAKIKALVDVLHSKEIQDFILKKWGGAVVPVNK